MAIFLLVLRSVLLYLSHQNNRFATSRTSLSANFILPHYNADLPLPHPFTGIPVRHAHYSRIPSSISTTRSVHRSPTTGGRIERVYQRLHPHLPVKPILDILQDRCTASNRNAVLLQAFYQREVRCELGMWRIGWL